MKRRAGTGVGLRWTLVALLLMAAAAYGREKPSEPEFKYAAGTENLYEGCEGNLEVDATGMTFRCRAGSVNVPFASIARMEYRQDVSRKVLKTKLRWKIKPAYQAPLLGGRQNRFFTVVFTADGRPHAMVLRVAPEAMRPYLAEIDLRAGRRVEVQGYEDY